jgi:hypothetical protein
MANEGDDEARVSNKHEEDRKKVGLDKRNIITEKMLKARETRKGPGGRRTRWRCDGGE